MGQKLSISVLFLSLFSTTFAFAAINYKQAVSKKMHSYVKEGVITGGESGTAFSLLNVRRRYARQSQVERVFIDLGDIQGRPLLNKVSFFQVSLDKNLNRVNIDLAQVQKSGIDQAYILKTFKKSKFVKNALLTFDPEDLSTSLILELKKSVEMEVFEMPSKKKSSRIIIDLKAI